MEFDQALTPGVLERRYKRFLADVRLDDGSLVTCHCPNTGSMLGCQEPGARVWLSRSDNPKRKYALTWEIVELAEGIRVGIHTGRANRLVHEAILAGRIPELGGYGHVQPEVRLPQWKSRIDFLLSAHDSAPSAYVEVKNVTAAVEKGVALFPDAVSARGTRHLEHLQALVGHGYRAALVFCVQRNDVTEVRPADNIDPAYGRALRQAISSGVEVHALGADVSETAVELQRPLPVVCPEPE